MIGPSSQAVEVVTVVYLADSHSPSAEEGFASAQARVDAGQAAR